MCDWFVSNGGICKQQVCSGDCSISNAGAGKQQLCSDAACLAVVVGRCVGFSSCSVCVQRLQDVQLLQGG